MTYLYRALYKQCTFSSIIIALFALSCDVSKAKAKPNLQFNAHSMEKRNGQQCNHKCKEFPYDFDIPHTYTMLYKMISAIFLYHRRTTTTTTTFIFTKCKSKTIIVKTFYPNVNVAMQNAYTYCLYFPNKWNSNYCIKRTQFN